MKKIKKVEVAFAVSFIIVLYFLLPYIFPIVGVRSFVISTGSMGHFEGNQSTFESFWKNKGIEPKDLPFRYGIRTGDLVVVVPSETYGLGDVVAIKKPGSQSIVIHRVYEYNSTHFRDVGDRCISEEFLKTVTLAIKDRRVFWVTNPEYMLFEPDKMYEGPRLETCGHYWTPVSYIDGKAVLSLRFASRLHMLLEDTEEEEPDMG
ncbi:MAG: hypothetical protein KAW40_01900 [Candidatus Aenigmarchaeota archaeon]|nr:hypothetical protein [Candidatus Aenigmarchaeota archaeon]